MHRKPHSYPGGRGVAHEELKLRKAGVGETTDTMADSDSKVFSRGVECTDLVASVTCWMCFALTQFTSGLCHQA